MWLVVSRYPIVHCLKCLYLPGMFYYTLGNLPPHLRSTQRSTLLLACVSSTNIQEYGFERILERFIKDINELSEVGVYCEM